MAPEEGDKFYNWSKWEIVYQLVDPIVNSLAIKNLQSFQSLIVDEKVLPDGYRRLKYKKAATGGTRKWTYKANEDISTRYLANPGQRILVRGTDIWAGEQFHPINGWDFYLKFRNVEQLKDSAFNQAINLFLSGELIKRLGRAVFHKLIEGLAQESFCLRLGSTSRRWAYIDKHYSPNGASADFLMDSDYSGPYNSLDLVENPFAKWDILI
jgi:hypothetical protein